MLKRLDHLGVAVRSLAPALALYRDRLGLAVEGVEEVPQEKVRVAFLPLGDTRLELLEPTADDSPVARFIDKRGEGLHHLCFEVEDLDGVLARLPGSGIELLPGYPRPGAEGGRVAFLHPRSTGGVLMELREGGGGKSGGPR
ncbi:MAG: methylmalonyl-CoA epimerase [Thermoanaerobaculia bacterium]